jgi:hypothetical protein
LSDGKYPAAEAGTSPITRMEAAAVSSSSRAVSSPIRLRYHLTTLLNHVIRGSKQRIIRGKQRLQSLQTNEHFHEHS